MELWLSFILLTFSVTLSIIDITLSYLNCFLSSTIRWWLLLLALLWKNQFSVFFFLFCDFLILFLDKTFSRISTYHGAALNQELTQPCVGTELSFSLFLHHCNNHQEPLWNLRTSGAKGECGYSQQCRSMYLPLLILSVFSNFSESSSHNKYQLIYGKAISWWI